MNGKFLFDTNAIIDLLNRNDLTLSEEQLDLIYSISIITELELLSSSNLDKPEEDAIIDICSNSNIVNIDQDIKNRTIKLRKKYKLKLPDAIYFFLVLCLFTFYFFLYLCFGCIIEHTSRF